MNDSTRIVDGLGERIRAERLARGLSAAELADRSGVGRGTVSGVEQGRTPTMSTLGRIADGLDLPVAALFAAPAPRPVERLPEGFDVWPLEIRLTDDAQVEVYRVTVTRTARQGPASPGGRGYITVTSGRMAVGSAATPRRLDVGGQLAFALDHPHVYEPVGGPADAILVLRYPHPAR